jgi:hypothetical protein
MINKIIKPSDAVAVAATRSVGGWVDGWRIMRRNVRQKG